MTKTLDPVVSSIFGAANLQSILSMVSSILQAALFPLYSKLSDTIGRAEILIVSMVFYTVSFVAQATANSYGVFVVSVPRSRMNIVDKIANELLFLNRLALL